VYPWIALASGTAFAKNAWRCFRPSNLENSHHPPKRGTKSAHL
jgi:hypothetical protein